MTLHVPTRNPHDGKAGNAAEFLPDDLKEELEREAEISGAHHSLQEVLENTASEFPSPEDILIAKEEQEAAEPISRVRNRIFDL